MARGVVCRPPRVLSVRQRGHACSLCLRGERESPVRSCQGRRGIRVAAMNVQRTILELCTATMATATTVSGGHPRATGVKEAEEAAAAVTTNAATMRAKEAGGQGRWRTQRRTQRRSTRRIQGRRPQKKCRYQVPSPKILSRHQAVESRALGLARNAPSTAVRQTLASRTAAAMMAMEGRPIIHGRCKTETGCRSTTVAVHGTRIDLLTKTPALRIPMPRVHRVVRGATAPGPLAHEMGVLRAGEGTGIVGSRNVRRQAEAEPVKANGVTGGHRP